MSKEEKARHKWERIRLESRAFAEVLERITGLTPIQYATLRSMIFGQTSKPDWDAMMIS